MFWKPRTKTAAALLDTFSHNQYEFTASRGGVCRSPSPLTCCDGIYARSQDMPFQHVETSGPTLVISGLVFWFFEFVLSTSVD
jgi:hypothetical protein